MNLAVLKNFEYPAHVGAVELTIYKLIVVGWFPIGSTTAGLMRLEQKKKKKGQDKNQTEEFQFSFVLSLYRFPSR